MVYNVDKVTIYLSILSVLSLSILTLLYFRKDKFRYNDEGSYLFEGKSVLYSLASTIGSLFSVTYFFGATFIYSMLYKSWLFFLVTASYVMVTKIFDVILVKIKKNLSQEEFKGSNHNILLLFLKKKMTTKNFQMMLWGLALAYLLLLIEELAVCRLLLSTLFPKNPEVTALLISTICFVLMSYLYIGGFKAVLKSDFLQIFVIVCFLITLAYFIFKGQVKAAPTLSSSNILNFSTNISNVNLVVALFVWLLVIIAWFMCSVDFFSRLNFKSKSNLLLKERQKFVRISLISFFCVAVIGVFFGQFLVESNTISYSFTPSSYTKMTIALFLSEGSRIIIVIFFTSIFCMMFTTMDTLFLTVLQIGLYHKKRIFKRKNLIKILAVVVFFSCLMESDSVSAIGIFFASIFIILTFPILKCVFFENSLWFPENNSYIKWSILLSTLVFASLYKLVKLEFELHFLIPIITLMMTFISVVLTKKDKKNLRGNNNEA